MKKLLNWLDSRLPETSLTRFEKAALGLSVTCAMAALLLMVFFFIFHPHCI